MKYQIYEEDSLFKLANAINNLISQGWKPLGGVAVYKDKNNLGWDKDIKYVQAMIKEEA